MKKKRLISLIVIVGIFALLTVGCGQQGPQTATLSLGANPTTGYEWTVEQEPEIFDISSEYVSDESAEPAVGVGGTQVFVLTPKEAGTAEVTFTYARSWEEEPDTELTYTLSVDKKMRIKTEAMAGNMGGTISTVPEMPDLVIE